jgi:hypothetical protein
LAHQTISRARRDVKLIRPRTIHTRR